MSAEVGNNDEGQSQGDTARISSRSDSLSSLHEETRKVAQKERSNQVSTVGHYFIVLCVVTAAVGLRLDRGIDIPTTSSVLIGALGYATGLTAGKSKNGH